MSSRMGVALSKSERADHESPAQCHGTGGGGRAGTSPEAKEPVAARPGRLLEAAPFRGRDARESPRQVNVREFITIAEALGTDAVRLLRQVLRRRAAP